MQCMPAKSVAGTGLEIQSLFLGNVCIHIPEQSPLVNRIGFKCLGNHLLPIEIQLKVKSYRNIDPSSHKFVTAAKWGISGDSLYAMIGVCFPKGGMRSSCIPS